MGLFSRRRPGHDDPGAALEPAGEAEPQDEASAQVVDAPHVGISISSFGAAATHDMASTGGAGGMPENALLRDAAAAFAADPSPRRLIDVARQLLQGPVVLRVQGDAQAALSEGRSLPFAVVPRDGEQYLAGFSGARALAQAVRADGAVDSSAMSRTARDVLQTVVDGPYSGLVVDAWAGRTAALLPRELLRSALESADPGATIKTLLAGARDAGTIAAIVSALADQRVWIAVSRASESAPWGVAETRTADGERLLTVFSHPLEVAALDRGDRPLPATAQQLARALRGDTGLAGILVDPAGPWLRLSRDDLGLLIARA